MKLLRFIDLVLLVGALPVFLAGGLPLLGWALGAGLWLAWRGVGLALERRAASSDDVRTRVGLLAGGMVARGWMLGLTLLVVGLATDREVGLSGSLLALVLFTAYFTMNLLLRPVSGADAKRRLSLS